MAHEAQVRYSKIADAVLRHTLVKKDGVIFNNNYEGDPKAGSVKVPVRNTEVEIGDYNKQTGAKITHGTTEYITVNITKDKAVNEVIDGHDAATVPDNLVAARLDSAGYSLGLQIEKDATIALETDATQHSDTTALTKTTVYDSFVDARTALSNNNIPKQGRWALVTPEVYGLILKCPEFIPASDLGDKIKQTGALGQIAGFNIYEDSTLSETTEYMVGHPGWCTRIHEWGVPVHVQDLSGSGNYIGASAVQGRKIYDHKVTNKKAVLIKKRLIEETAYIDKSKVDECKVV